MKTGGEPIPSVWARPKRQRREQPPLSREQIVAEAIRILDAEGVDALSMRRLGTELKAGATSMYTHVATKDELMELVVDEVIGETSIPSAEGPDDWRRAAVECAHNFRAVILRHPWLVSTLGGIGLAYLGPNVMRMSDRMIAIFLTAGFTLTDADHAVNTLFGYVIGVGTGEAAQAAAIARSGQTEQEWMERVWPIAERAVQPYPRLRDLYAATHNADLADYRRSTFSVGLDVILDGLEARFTRDRKQ